ncbi:MAG: arylsulfatase [Rikenellaceae bacterium]
MDYKLILFAAVTGLCSCSEKSERPNVLVVLADDQGYGDFSCHGNPVIKTPNLDIMHENSIRLTEFHVAPVSTPTRGEFLTGRDALNNGAWSWGYGREVIDPNVPTIANIFADAGYTTAHFGKWHLGDNYPFRPQDKGFQESIRFGGAATHQSADYWQNDNFDDFYKMYDGSIKQFKGYCTDVWFDLTMNFMSKCQDEKQPFFIYLPTNAAHSPQYVEERYSEPYKDQKLKGLPDFFGMISNLDENMGRLNDFLKKEGLYENTIVIYFTDNGGTTGVKLFNGNRRGHKHQFYDGGHRAACFVQWPAGGLLKSYDLEELTHSQDILPTLLDLCDIETSKELRESFDGFSLADAMRDKSAKLEDRKIVVQFSTLERPEYGVAAVLWKNWRLVHNNELYDIVNDPLQNHDISDENPDVMKQMQDHYAQWWEGNQYQANAFHRVIAGGDENPMTITCFDWTTPNSKFNRTQQSTIWQGQRMNGTWWLSAEEAGEYEIRLSRYPEEADCAISAAYPARQREFVKFDECVALPIKSVEMLINDTQYVANVGAEDRYISFKVTLPKGDFNLRTAFCDAAGEEICGAYYARIERL